MIAVRSWERAKGMTRIEFVAGVRALADYRKANKSAREVAALFSTGRDDAPQLAAQMVEEHKELNRRIRVLEEIAAERRSGEVISHSFKRRRDSSIRRARRRVVEKTRTRSHRKSTIRSPCSRLATKTRRALSSHVPQTPPAT